MPAGIGGMAHGTGTGNQPQPLEQHGNQGPSTVDGASELLRDAPHTLSANDLNTDVERSMNDLTSNLAQTSLAAGDSQTMLELELTDPASTIPSSSPHGGSRTPDSYISRSRTASSTPHLAEHASSISPTTSPTRSAILAMSSFAKSYTSPSKALPRSRSPGPANALDSSIPFSASVANSAAQGASSSTADFFGAFSSHHQHQSGQQQQHLSTPTAADPRRAASHGYLNNPSTFNSSPTSSSSRKPSIDVNNTSSGLYQRHSTTAYNPPTSHQHRPSVSSVISLESAIAKTTDSSTTSSLLDMSPTNLAAGVAQMTVSQPNLYEPTAPPKDPPSSTHYTTPSTDPKLHNHLPILKWTHPSIFTEIPAHDPIMDAVSRSFPVSESARPQRRLLKLEDAERQHGDNALLALIQSNSWRAASLLAKKKLVGLNSTFSSGGGGVGLVLEMAKLEEVMLWWLVRLIALERLRHFEALNIELERLGVSQWESAPEWKFESHPEVFGEGAGKMGCMVSFELRLYAARFPVLKGGHTEALKRLYTLLYQTRVARLSEVGEKQLLLTREVQIQLHIANVLLDMKDYKLALKVLEGVLVFTSDDVDLLSAVGRVYLQLGDVHSAKRLFDKVESILLPESAVTGEPANINLTSSSSRPDLILTHRAFSALADSQYPTTIQHLSHLLTIPPSATPSKKLEITTTNNLSVSHLYTGSLPTALSHLENLSTTHPGIVGGCPQLLFNLCTLYELVENSAGRKKRVLGTVVASGGGDDLDVACLKM
ncbi:Trafficking protein particle complex subunit 12 [Chytridiales sp. JEL 0842]|nr:Trafficking protein particle complex subunit 12 [Chytridiales sp. JEL 0842]